MCLIICSLNIPFTLWLTIFSYFQHLPPMLHSFVFRVGNGLTCWANPHDLAYSVLHIIVWMDRMISLSYTSCISCLTHGRSISVIKRMLSAHHALYMQVRVVLPLVVWPPYHHVLMHLFLMHSQHTITYGILVNKFRYMIISDFDACFGVSIRTEFYICLVSKCCSCSDENDVVECC